MSFAFPAFDEEVRAHAAAGYHQSTGPIAALASRDALARQGITPCPAYLAFLERFGPGRYFAGSLVLYSFRDGMQSIESRSRQLPDRIRVAAFPFGSDGTAEGCYCLDRRGRDARVFWYAWGADALELEAEDFVAWVESQPAALFNPRIFRGYGPVRDPAGIALVVEQRAAVDVRLAEFDPQPVPSPWRLEQASPRYHRLVLGVFKRREVELRKLTVAVLRTGSRYGGDNRVYETLDIAAVPVGLEVLMTVHALDAFGVPFRAIELEHEPVIDLDSPRRVRFREIAEYL